MATFTLDELITPLTSDQVRLSIYRVMAAVGVNTTSWKPGAVVRTMISATSIVMAGLSQLTANVARSGFLELSTGQWLTLVARYVYNVERITATFASGVVTMTNSGGGVYILDPGDLIVGNATTGKTFRNTQAITIGALSSLDIVVEAVEVGSGSTSSPGAITTLETPLLGVTCTNALAIVGEDDELDAALRLRCSEKLGSLSPFGPPDAYAYAARNATRLDGSNVGVTRVRVTKDGYGNVATYVASATGVVTGAASDPTTDLGSVDYAIQHNAAPLAVTAYTRSAEAVVIPVTYTAFMYNNSGLSEQQIKDLISAKLVLFIASQAIGGNVVGGDPGKIFQDAIRTAIGSTLPQIFHVVVTAPAADTVLAVNQVAVLGTVTATSITQSPPTDGSL